MESWQDKFDAYLVSLYAADTGKCGFVWNMFCDRYGIDESLGYSHYGISRFPNEEFAYRTVQTWLYQSYPNFVDAVHLCNKKEIPVSGIKLCLLRFVSKKKPDSVGNGNVINDLRRAQNKSRASYIDHSLRKNNPFNTTRVKMPAVKRARK